MNTFWGLSATAWTAIYTLLTAGLLAVAVLAARYAKKQIEEAQRAHREATRPYVIVSVESTAVARHFFDLCVRNIGQRPAFNVEIDLDPPPISSDEVAGHEIANIKMLTEPVAMIAPAQEMRAFYDSHRERQKATDLPSNHRVTLKYRDSSGHVYQEYSVLDLEAMRGTTYLDEKTIHHVAKSLDDIKKTLKSASVLKRHGDISVDAVIEEFSAHVERVEREEYERAVDLLAVYRSQGAQGRQVSQTEGIVADYERTHSNPTTGDSEDQ